MLEFFVVGLQLVCVRFLRGAEGALDEIDGILRLLGFLIKSDEHLGELINDSSLFEELTELLLLLLSCLNAH